MDYREKYQKAKAASSEKNAELVLLWENDKEGQQEEQILQTWPDDLDTLNRPGFRLASISARRGSFTSLICDIPRKMEGASVLPQIDPRPDPTRRNT